MDQKETGISILKSMFSNIPVAGQLLSEVFFELRGRIKQNRLNAFTELIAAHFANDPKMDFSRLNKVEFSDLFEAVVLRVVRTDSIEKHKRFRDILIGQMESPDRSIDHADTFLDLVSLLSEPAIQILKYHDRYDTELGQWDAQEDQLKNSIKEEKQRIEKEKQAHKNIMTLLPRESDDRLERATRQLQQVQEQIKKLGKYRKAVFYGLSVDDFLYLKQILVSRALMTDAGFGINGAVPYLLMRITRFGKLFIGYIREDLHSARP